ncbi:MAG: DUF1259 domain-containing protein [Myxococcota bacterium]
MAWQRTGIRLVVLVWVAPWVGCDEAEEETGREPAAPKVREVGKKQPEGLKPPEPAPLDAERIAGAAQTEASKKNGVVRIEWVRDQVPVKVDGMPFPPPAGLGSWAAFQPAQDGAMVMGDTVVFQDEVDAAMDSAFAHGLEVTALHNHFFYDEPKVYFMHIGGQADAAELARGVRAVWDAIRAVRDERPKPAESFAGEPPQAGEIDPEAIAAATGVDVQEKPGGVLKVSVPATTRMGGVEMGGAMGVATWAAFSGTTEHAAMDGDFVMTAEQVQPVLRTLRKGGVHVVALHNHMVGEDPPLYFTHFWAKGPAAELARAFKDTVVASAQAAAR